MDPRYHLTPYYIAPRDIIGQEAFAVIRDAMASKDVIALGHIVLSNRERPIILEPLGLGLRGITLHYAHEIRGEAEYLANIPQMELPPQMLRLAEHIVESKLANFDTTLLEDRYRTSLVSMLREKKAQCRRAQQRQFGLARMLSVSWKSSGAAFLRSSPLGSTKRDHGAL